MMWERARRKEEEKEEAEAGEEEYRPVGFEETPLGHTSSPLATHSAVLPDEEEEEEEEEMVADIGDSPSIIQEMLTPRTEGNDTAIFAVDNEGSPWLPFATMDDGFSEHTRHHSWGWRDAPSTHTSKCNDLLRERKATPARSW
jgi:hypothetical protein